MQHSFAPNLLSIAKLLFLAIAVGASSAVFAANNTPQEIARYLKKQGPVLEHRVFRSSASNQIVVSFCIDENFKGGANAGASNPANVYCKVALFNKKEKWTFANQAFLGQGTVREFAIDKVLAESVTYAPEDPLCCPSIKKELVFKTGGGTLVASPQLLSAKQGANSRDDK
ncbi:hypothetical protein AEP_00062 [Curvibacter sp. AEP1-3]|uniref:hypothetical protein n=1 Tax=Curvibacter sp. AEP1-3 TaxID=1844971 RepID=UPI000B5693C6|nr:hypothetical protein [Curvibacter sp. AEP1-3]ARV17028.1 hypothetical protein AEP_00062 [Curvibacter sp. AEP1-3]